MSHCECHDCNNCVVEQKWDELKTWIASIQFPVTVVLKELILEKMKEIEDEPLQKMQELEDSKP